MNKDSEEGDWSRYPREEYVINDIPYKIGAHGFVYYFLGGEWVKSNMSQIELIREIIKNET